MLVVVKSRVAPISIMQTTPDTSVRCKVLGAATATIVSDVRVNNWRFASDNETFGVAALAAPNGCRLLLTRLNPLLPLSSHQPYCIQLDPCCVAIQVSHDDCTFLIDVVLSNDFTAVVVVIPNVDCDGIFDVGDWMTAMMSSSDDYLGWTTRSCHFRLYCILHFGDVLNGAEGLSEFKQID
jgi:hypothetical protein